MDDKSDDEFSEKLEAERRKLDMERRMRKTYEAIDPETTQLMEESSTIHESQNETVCHRQFQTEEGVQCQRAASNEGASPSVQNKLLEMHLASLQVRQLSVQLSSTKKFLMERLECPNLPPDIRQGLESKLAEVQHAHYGAVLSVTEVLQEENEIVKAWYKKQLTAEALILNPKISQTAQQNQQDNLLLLQDIQQQFEMLLIQQQSKVEELAERLECPDATPEERRVLENELKTLQQAQEETRINVTQIKAFQLQLKEAWEKIMKICTEDDDTCPFVAPTCWVPRPSRTLQSKSPSCPSRRRATSPRAARQRAPSCPSRRRGRSRSPTRRVAPCSPARETAPCSPARETAGLPGTPHSPTLQELGMRLFAQPTYRAYENKKYGPKYIDEHILKRPPVRSIEDPYEDYIEYFNIPPELVEINKHPFFEYIDEFVLPRPPVPRYERPFLENIDELELPRPPVRRGRKQREVTDKMMEKYFVHSKPLCRPTIEIPKNEAKRKKWTKEFYGLPPSPPPRPTTPKFQPIDISDIPPIGYRFKPITPNEVDYMDITTDAQVNELLEAYKVNADEFYRKEDLALLKELETHYKELIKDLEKKAEEIKTMLTYEKLPFGEEIRLMELSETIKEALSEAGETLGKLFHKRRRLARIQEDYEEDKKNAGRRCVPLTPGVDRHGRPLPIPPLPSIYVEGKKRKRRPTSEFPVHLRALSTGSKYMDYYPELELEKWEALYPLPSLPAIHHAMYPEPAAIIPGPTEASVYPVPQASSGSGRRRQPSPYIPPRLPIESYQLYRNQGRASQDIPEPTIVPEPAEASICPVPSASPGSESEFEDLEQTVIHLPAETNVCPVRYGPPEFTIPPQFLQPPYLSQEARDRYNELLAQQSLEFDFTGLETPEEVQNLWDALKRDDEEISRYFMELNQAKKDKQRIEELVAREEMKVREMTERLQCPGLTAEQEQEMRNKLMELQEDHELMKVTLRMAEEKLMEFEDEEEQEEEFEQLKPDTHLPGDNQLPSGFILQLPPKEKKFSRASQSRVTDPESSSTCPLGPASPPGVASPIGLNDVYFMPSEAPSTS
ncbi:uncharacterized protein [Narcine bancroftii]|uniref:uncharacterized protein isoform X2 n=1 Tax=Narcine bancroftii TaxID=1343680 RepID=UPI0038314A9F